MQPAVGIRETLEEKRTAIIDRWKELTLQVYPERAARFIRKERDRFHNPVGYVTGESLALLYDALVVGAPAEKIRHALDGIVRIRAVQDLSPSEGIGFVFLLKQAIGEELGGAGTDPSAAELAELNDRIDRLALEAFDLFVQCREKIYELRLREIRGRTSTLPQLRRSRDSEEPEGADR